MPLFRCETCGCIENTATGFFYGKDAAHWPDDVRGKALCSACGPAIGPDGKPTGFGAWHGEFTRETATGMLIDNRGFLRGKDEALPSSVTIVGVVKSL